MRYLICILIVGFLGSCATDDPPKASDPKGNPATDNTTASNKQKPAIIFFGNSLSAGYGISPDSAFPALIQYRLDSLSLAYTVVNAGVSGETTATGRNRVAWVVSRQPVSIFVLELGGNDGLRGIPPAETKQNLEAIIDSVRSAHPDARIVLAGMMVPPNMGADYSKAYSKVFPAVAASKKTALIPFLLEGVGGVDSLNQADGIHPTEAGHRIVAENVWTILQPILTKS